MDLLPYTKRAMLFLSDPRGPRVSMADRNFAVGGWVNRRFSDSRFYWKPDLYDMGMRLADLEKDRDVGEPGAEQRLTSFREERIHLVDSIVQVNSILSSVRVRLIRRTGQC
jgi:hypothetical protein